ncbi:MAG TPA: 2OG-Fe(II) oxygenase [Nostocaceae cyanobacterium]|nr:2OG-Fe(II) oxygenase [Nostocaceae cyanobacterium]
MDTILLKIRKKILRKIDQHPFTRDYATRIHQQALAEHNSNLPMLSEKHKDLVEKVKQEGVVITSLEELGITSGFEMWKSAQNLLTKIQSKRIDEQDEIVVHANPQQMMEYPNIFLWGVEANILRIVENYIGLPVAYQGCHLRRDIANQLEKGSRLWHIDQEDHKIFKIIVYLNDVNEDGGPFQYIPKPLTDKLVQILRYTSGYINDETMQKFISPSNYKSCTGTAGTVVLASTDSILHRGKPPISSDRFTVFFDYTSRRHKQALHGTYTLPYHDLLFLSKNLSQEQKNCIFW